MKDIPQKSPILLAVGFTLVAIVIATVVCVAVADLGAPENLLNLWPLSVGLIGFSVVAWTNPQVRNRALVLFAIATAALVLFVLRSVTEIYWPIQAALIALLVGTLLHMWRSPVDQLGARLAPADLKWVWIGLLMGLLPTAGPYLILRLLGFPAVEANPEWAWIDTPVLGAIHILVAAGILLLNNLVGEEAGWRGWLTTTLKGKLSRRSLVWGLALLFAVWHIPFDIIIAGMDAGNLVVNQITRLLMGAAFLYFFVASDGRLLGVCVFHTAHNLVVYEGVSPTGILQPAFEGLDALAYVGLYLSLSIFLVWITGRLARPKMSQWVRSSDA